MADGGSWLVACPHHRRQWAHGPKWHTHASTSGERWFGFEAVQDAPELGDGILLVPLAGHTRGHCGVAVQAGGGWLLHAGDAVFYGGELESPTRPHPVFAFLAEANETDREQRFNNLERLRELHATAGPAVQIFGAHDAWALQRLLDRADAEHAVP